MKFTCNKEDLLKIITAAEPITGLKSNFTILSNILMETRDSDSLIIKASNQEMSMSATIPAKIANPGSITIIQSKLSNIVKQLPEGDIAVEMGKGSMVSIKSMDKKRNANTSLIGLPTKDFPEVPPFSEKSDLITIDKLYFKKMIQKVIFSVSSDNTKYTLDGVLLECSEDRIKMVAIDGRRMAMIENEYPKHQHQPFSAIIPQEFLSQLQKVLLTEGPLMFYFSDNILYVKFDNMECSTSILSGNFPDYKMFIPKTHDHLFNVNTQELVGAINLASVLMDTTSNKLAWKISENTLNISAHNSDYGESKEDIFITYQGPEHNIGINFKLLSEILREIETEEAEFKFNNALSPLIIKEKNRSEYFFILMPMKLDN